MSLIPNKSHAPLERPEGGGGGGGGGGVLV